MAINTTALILVSLIFLVAFFFKYRTSKKLPKYEGKPAPLLTGEMGKAVQSGEKVLFFFFERHGVECRAQMPIVEVIKKEKLLPVFEVDLYEDEKIYPKFNVTATPSLVLVEGNKIKKFMVGNVNLEKLKRIIKS